MAMPASAPEPADGPAVSVSVLGTMSVAVSGRDIRIKNRKSSAVLAYVVLNEALRETRERLVGLFWSESDEEKARGSLRQSLRELRALFGEAGYRGFHTDKLAVELDRGSIDVDLWAVIREADAGRAHPLLMDRPRLLDSLLDGFDDLDPSFRVWLLAKRETIKNRIMRSLEGGLRDESLSADVRSQLAAGIINLDPTHEEACRVLMRAKAEAGDTSGALRVYKTLWDLLDADYDMEPAAATQRLVADVKSGAFDQAAPPVASPAESSGVGAQRSVMSHKGAIATPALAPPRAKIELALEEFDAKAVDRDKVHLVVGFRMHLIASLVRFREWYVTDQSVQSPAGRTGSAGSARYAIQAAAYQGGEAVGLVLTLRQTDTNHFVWSETFELKLDSWFEAQRRVVRRLTMALNVNLSTERLMRLATQPDISLDIYDKWLQGQSDFLSYDPANRRRAAQTFGQVIGEAPHFSPAYSNLAQLLNTEHIAFPGLIRSRDKEKETLALARTAVQLDPMDSRAHLCLAWSLIMSKQYDQAQAPVELACELNDNDYWTLISSATILAFCANIDRSQELAALTAGLSVSPSRTYWAFQAIRRFLCGDYEGCVDAGTQSGAVPAGQHGWVAAALVHLGRRDEAAEEAQRFLDYIRSHWFGFTPPTHETIMRWYLHIFPIRRREDWERLRDGLAGVGLPVRGTDHHAW
jgi:DNA-binding SARP family transcriptional activator/TolB-like protein